MQKQHWLRAQWLTAAMASAFWLGIAISSQAQSPPLSVQGSAVLGSDVFRTYCAACHGTSAKGDGPLADSMRRRPADLTEIATRNGGIFPADQVFRTIDGRQPIKGHGGPDMPVWGDAFKRSLEGGDAASVRRKIESLVKYLESIQSKLAN